MNKHLQNYLNSFKKGKLIFYCFLVDLIIMGSIWGSFWGWGSYLQEKSKEVLGGRTVEQIQQSMLAEPEKALVLLEQVKVFLLGSIISGVVLGVAAVLLFSLSGGLIWNRLLGKKLTGKNYWKWNGLNLALIFPLGIFGIIYLVGILISSLVFRFLLTAKESFYLAHPGIVEGSLTVLNGMVGFGLVLGFLIFVFLVYYSFTEKYKVWEAIGEGFHLIRKRWGRLGKLWLLVWGTGGILGLGAGLAKGIFYNEMFSFFLSLVFSFLFLAWMRVYVVGTVKE